MEFLPEHESELFAAAPAAAAVFVLRGEAGSEPYVGKSSNLRRRLQRLLGAVEGQSRKLNLRDRVREVEWTATGSDFEAALLLYKTLRREFPASYGDRMRFRFAPLVKLILDNAYPRATVTTRISGRKSGAEYFGPFATRVAAEKFANDSLDFFKMRRCTDDLNPDPAFPGCIYSEMKMCLAPCFKGCTDEEYAAEVGRVREYFASGGQSLVREIEKMRDEASAGLDFEGAAALHARLEKVKAAKAQLPEIVRRLDELNGVMIQPSAEADSVALFKIAEGRICDPVRLDVASKSEAAHMQAQAAVDGGEDQRGAGGSGSSEAAERTGVDGASGAAEAMVLPHRKSGRVISDGREWRVADAAGGKGRVAGVQGREAGGGFERDGGGVLEVPGGGGWGEQRREALDHGFTRMNTDQV